MKTRHKAKLTRVAGNLLVLIAVCLGLLAIAMPDFGPRPDSWPSKVACILACIPAFAFGVLLRRRALQLKEKSEMESCIEELNQNKPNKHMSGIRE